VLSLRPTVPMTMFRWEEAVEGSCDHLAEVFWGGVHTRPCSGGGVSGGDVSGGDVSGGDVSGGDVLGGDVSGGDVLGGDVSGGDVSGGGVSGGGVSGRDVSGWGFTSEPPKKRQGVTRGYKDGLQPESLADAEKRQASPAGWRLWKIHSKSSVQCVYAQTLAFSQPTTISGGVRES